MELTKEDIKRLEEIQPTLISMYKESGYERAISLQKEIEEDTKNSIFDIPAISREAANCFHSGTWAVWNGDGVGEMTAMLNGDYYNSVDEIIEHYKGNAPYVAEFVKVAEEYSKAIEELQRRCIILPLKK